MNYEDFVIQMEAGGQGRIQVRVSCSLGGEGRGWLNPPAGHPSDTAEELGERLFMALFRGEVLRVLDRSLGSAEGSRDVGLRIKLKLDLTREEEARLHSLPWELLRRADTAQFLSLRRRSPVVRYLDVPQPVHVPRLPNALRVLMVTAEGETGPPLYLDREWTGLQHLAKENQALRIERLHQPSLLEVRHTLLDGGYHVLHFSGHGGTDPDRGVRSLLFHGREGDRHVTATDLTTALQDLSDLRLVLLNACDAGRPNGVSHENPFSGFAPALMRGGVPAVLAMQDRISDSNAREFTGAFYRRLTAGDPVDSAVSEGRQAIHASDRHSHAWAKPALFMRVPTGELFRAPREMRSGKLGRDRDGSPTGIDHLLAGNYTEAASLLRQQIAHLPDDPQHKTALGIALARGRRLRGLDYRVAKQMHRLFAEAMGARGGEALASSALLALKHDYFKRNSVRDTPPDIAEVRRLLTRRSLDPTDRAIISHLNMSDCVRRMLAETLA